MNKIIAISFILQVIVGNTLSFDSKDVCLKKSIHVGKYADHNRYTIIEIRENCSNKTNPVECGPDYCAVKKETCNKFINARLISKIFKLSSNMLHDTDSIERKIQEVKSCAYTFNSNDICINTRKCYQRASGVLDYKSIRMLMPTKCKCLSEMSFHCGESHCAVHKEACDFFKTKKNQTQPKFCNNMIIV